MTPRLIADPEQIDSTWLTEVLAYAGTGGRVSDFDAKSIGTGQVGENVRFTLQGDGVPGSIVGKFPSTDPVSRQTGIQQQNYLKEVFFYKTLKDTVDVQTPEVLFTDINSETHDFVLMMEDLAPGVQGDQLQGCSVDDAALALEELAKFQGPRWGDQTLLQYELLGGGVADAEQAAMLQMLYQTLEEGYLGRYGDRLDSDDLRVTHEVGEQLKTYHAIWQGQAKSLVHVDYRLDNMMFGGPYPLAVVDWQSVNLGCPVADVSYFMGTSLLPEDRGREEQALLRHYLDVLKSYKVELDYDTCFACYRNYAPAGLIMAVIASMIVGETERGNDMFMAMATRSAKMVVDLK